MGKPKVLYLPTPGHTQLVFRKETYRRMCQLFDVHANQSDRNYATEEIIELVPGYDAIVTGWGTPPLTEGVFEKADRLRIIAHSAGSVKHMLSEKVVRRYILPKGIVVFSANEAIAYNVAESTIGMMIMAKRRWPEHIRAFRDEGTWRAPEIPRNGQFLMGSTVGVIGASKVGRLVMRFLEPFHVRILVYDPYLSEWEAGRLGAEKVGLEELFRRSDIVTLHAPDVPETERMIRADHLRLMKDGAVFVNTARGRLVDHEALLREAKTGRIVVILDVTDPEPLPPDSPFRGLPNVYITPHIAGAGYYGYFRIGDTTLRALENCLLLDKPVEGAVPLERYAQLA